MLPILALLIFKSMGRAKYTYHSRDSFLENAGTNNYKCPECDVWGTFTLEERKPIILNCYHCKGSYTVTEHGLEANQCDNVKPLYLDD